jgi:hypothetical protein
MNPDRKQKRMFNRRTMRRFSHLRDEYYVRVKKVMAKRGIDMTATKIKITMAIELVTRYRLIDTINQQLKEPR